MISIQEMAGPAHPTGGQDPAPDVGARLRALRDLYGMSQRELAKRAGVTNSSISLIEKNRNSPTIALLRKVLSGFPVSIAEFFSTDAIPSAEIFYRREHLTQIRGQRLVYRQIGSSMGGRNLQMLHEHYEPAGDTGQVMLSHEGQEAGVVVRGRIEVTVGGQRCVLGPGDAYYFDSRIPHRFRNTSSQVGEIVSACTPPNF